MLTQIRPAIAPRPFLKWAGGKSQLLQQYLPFFPQTCRNYYEPFLGGGAAFFFLNATAQPQRAFLMDINLELINVYRCVKEDVGRVIDLLTQHQAHHCETYYYQVRSHTAAAPNWFDLGPDWERATRLIYLNKTCFNGLYRENSKGHFNVPIGRYKNPPILDEALLTSASESLQTAQIEVQSFEVILEHATAAEDFVYFDPPYFPISETSKFTSYNRDAFTADDQIRLRDTFVALSQRGVKVMLSNSDCSLIRDLYAGYNIHTIYASRNINSKGSKRGKISELLITSY
jgi:DNA adenine methylase